MSLELWVFGLQEHDSYAFELSKFRMTKFVFAVKIGDQVLAGVNARAPLIGADFSFNNIEAY